MTLIEISALMLWLAVASAASFAVGHVLGALGFMLGFIGTMVVPVLLSWLYSFADERLLLRPDGTPPCICGSREFSHEPDAEHSFIHRCACARAYARRGYRVFLIEPGRARPYQSWVRFRGWLPCVEPAVATKPYR